MPQNFAQRLSKAFDNASMADIARRLGLPHATIRNYFRGRIPAPDVLIMIADETNVSLDWLLMERGEMFIPGSRPVDIGRLIDERIEAIVDERLSRRAKQSAPKKLPEKRPAKKFDIAASLKKFNDPHRTMLDWFTFEGREYPRDFAVAFFRGWESFTDEEKIDAVNDAKKVLDRSLKNS